MLKNRVFVVGLEKSYLELMAQMKSEFLFISLNHPEQFDPINHE